MAKKYTIVLNILTFQYLFKRHILSFRHAILFRVSIRQS